MTGKPPESSVYGFMGFEYEFLPQITDSYHDGELLWLSYARHGDPCQDKEGWGAICGRERTCVS